jgi:hypothetical protein
MNTIAKFLLALALLAFLSACGPANSINTNAAQVTKAAAEIADFELPAGYRPDFTARLMGYTIAAFNPGDGHGHLYRSSLKRKRMAISWPVCWKVLHPAQVTRRPV